MNIRSIDYSGYNFLEGLLLTYFNQDWIENSTNNHSTGIHSICVLSRRLGNIVRDSI